MSRFNVLANKCINDDKVKSKSNFDLVQLYQTRI